MSEDIQDIEYNEIAPDKLPNVWGVITPDRYHPDEVVHQPTPAPTAPPTEAPTEGPTEGPTAAPTEAPTTEEASTGSDASTTTTEESNINNDKSSMNIPYVSFTILLGLLLIVFILV